MTNESSVQRTVDRRNVIELRNGWTDWLSAHEWTWYGTFTFRSPSLSEKWADRHWKTWTRALEERLAPPRARRGRVRWARATEWQQRGALHYHALLHGPQLDHENPEEWSKTWWRIAHGYAQIAFPEDVRACAGYLAKHVPVAGVIDLGGAWKDPVCPRPDRGWPGAETLRPSASVRTAPSNRVGKVRHTRSTFSPFSASTASYPAHLRDPNL